jgi:hypothetical protein
MTKPHNELEDTELGTQIEKAFEGLKHGPSRSTLMTIGVVLGVALLVLVGRWLWTSSEESSSQRWTKLDSLVFPQLVDEMLKERDLDGTTQARMGRYIEARLKLRDGLRRLAADKDAALKSVASGTATYEDLLKTEKSMVLRQEAILGAAKGYETQNNLPRAIELYRQMSKEFPNSLAARDAEKQAKRLEDAANREDLDALGARLSGKPS